MDYAKRSFTSSVRLILLALWLFGVFPVLAMDRDVESSPKTPRKKVQTAKQGLYSPVEDPTPQKEDHEQNIEGLENLVRFPTPSGLPEFDIPDYFRGVLQQQFELHSEKIGEMIEKQRQECLRKIQPADEESMAESREKCKKTKDVKTPDDYFWNLISDPNLEGVLQNRKKGYEGTVVKFVLEALIGLKAVDSGKIKGPILRGPSEIEFYNETEMFDVKTSRFNLYLQTYKNEDVDPKVAKHLQDLVAAIIKELSTKQSHPLGNKETSQNVEVILDASFLSEKKSNLLTQKIWEAFDEQSPGTQDSKALRDRIIKVDIRSELGFARPKKLEFH